MPDVRIPLYYHLFHGPNPGPLETVPLLDRHLRGSVLASPAPQVQRELLLCRQVPVPIQKPLDKWPVPPRSPPWTSVPAPVRIVVQGCATYHLLHVMMLEYLPVSPAQQGGLVGWHSRILASCVSPDAPSRHQ